MNPSSAAMPLEWTVQRVSPQVAPGDDDFGRWITAACADGLPLAGELTLRIVDADESASLNATYRGKNKPTNVLSFGYDGAPGIAGDLVFCAPVVAAESAEQGKRESDHWAHLTIHGLLHLAGFDHVVSSDATIMESREIAILATLGISNPYHEASEAPASHPAA